METVAHNVRISGIYVVTLTDINIRYDLTVTTEHSEVEDTVLNTFVTTCTGARGGVVVKALRYKPAGRGFDSRWCQDFSP